MLQEKWLLLLLLVIGSGMTVAVARMLKELARVHSRFAQLETQQDKGSQFVREEIAKNRDESAREFRGVRGELSQAIAAELRCLVGASTMRFLTLCSAQRFIQG